MIDMLEILYLAKIEKLLGAIQQEQRQIQAQLEEQLQLQDQLQLQNQKRQDIDYITFGDIGNNTTKVFTDNTSLVLFILVILVNSGNLDGAVLEQFVNIMRNMQASS
ncbi:hypothetical protein ACERII_10340 [Evansella sp. AB-rgal1]|uniref:hypothetical protein n=1 Tax=Evansella sp. AB-rgal1 TaxID=3242696 RepID=UPI00359EB2F6